MRFTAGIPFQLFNKKLVGNVNYNYSLYYLDNMKNGYELSDDRRKDYWGQSVDGSIAYQITAKTSLGVEGEYKVYGKPYRMEKEPYVYFSASFSQTWGKNDAWGARLEVANIFDTHNIKTKYIMDGATYDDNSRLAGRIFELGVRYQFQSGKRQNQYHTLPIDKSRLNK